LSLPALGYTATIVLVPLNIRASAAPNLRIIESLADVSPAAWDALAGDHPLLSHAFLHALHETGCASADSGWAPQYLTLWQGAALVGAMPLYLKSHSYGEYVFDWAWAEAYQRHGLRYYPKLLAAIPFTPATGPRLLARDASQRKTLCDAALALARDTRVSSLHVLFPDAAQADEFASAGMMLRHGVQFVWTNAGYRDFADYLAHMNHDKRKKIKQERRKVHDARVQFVHLDGSSASADDWRFFYRCYTHTYREHRSTPYLSLDFFLRLAATMPDKLLLIIGRRDDRSLCSALNIHNAHTLYGRYWGATEHLDALHFETCYYQALEFCIARGLQRFEGGAQGAHKLARGFLPVTTYSAHWLADARFARAVDDWMAREKIELAQEVDELADSSPFKAG
jgi:hypothetical protein